MYLSTEEFENGIIIYSGILEILNICCVQFIGNQISTEQNLLTYLKENTTTMLPVVLDSVNSSHAGQYYRLILKPRTKTQPRGKTQTTYQIFFCPGSGTVTILLTQWIFHSVSVIKNPAARIANTVGVILLTMASFNEDPKYIFIQTNNTDKKSSLQKLELQVDHTGFSISSSFRKLFKRTSFQYKPCSIYKS